MVPDLADLLTAEELAERLKVQPETIRGWARRGLIPRIQFSPKVIRYDLAAAVEHARANELLLPR